jgi:hypothetical protein
MGHTIKIIQISFQSIPCFDLSSNCYSVKTSTALASHVTNATVSCASLSDSLIFPHMTNVVRSAEPENANAWEAKDDLSSAESTPNPRGGRKPPKLSQAMQKRQQQTQQLQQPPSADEGVIAPPAERSRRIVPVHQSRIQDRPAKVGEKDSSLKIKIELDLEVEVEIYARVKGDVTIGLM